MCYSTASNNEQGLEASFFSSGLYLGRSSEYNNRMNYNVIEKTLYYGGKMRRSAVKPVNDVDLMLCSIVYRVTANLQGRENCTANKSAANKNNCLI
jgi:hypothetical protein